MRYSVKTEINNEALFNYSEGFMESAKSELFHKLADGLQKNLSGTVLKKEDGMRGNTELELVLHVYSTSEFKDKMRELDRVIADLPDSTKHVIRQIFRNDTMAEHKRNIKDKVYI